MDSAVELAKLLQNGGPWVTCALVMSAWVWERRENWQLQKSILELAKAQTEAVVKHEVAIATLKEILSQFISQRRT
jgi:hypothetical protein